VSDTGRIEAFSDGVLAIAVTLLVLDLHVPIEGSFHGSLAAALAHEWPAYAAYVTSFLIIGIIWVNHHGVFQLIGRVDRMTLFLNLLLLMTVVAIPFTTSLLSEYLRAGGPSARTAALVYSAVMLLMSGGFAGLYTYVATHPVLLAVGTLLYVATLVIAVFSAPLCLLAHFVIALYYCFQQIRPARAAESPS
jgi:uncharacterized membrane protein